jgi:hypothetical protein
MARLDLTWRRLSLHGAARKIARLVSVSVGPRHVKSNASSRAM